MSLREKLTELVGGEDELRTVLSELVHDAKSREASAINNAGVGEQLDYLMETVGFTEADLVVLVVS